MKASETVGACIELMSSALDVQEYLQAYVRDQKWKLIDEHVTEDSWTFSRELSPDELNRNTKAYTGTHKMEWTKGTVLVNVDSAPMDDGWTRTTITATFRGYGEDQDQFATQREYWELKSNNALEQSLAAKVLAHMKD